MSKRKALFPGTFDPYTAGHHSLVERALALVDEVVVAIGYNEGKRTLYTLAQRQAMLEQLYAHHPRVTVVHYEGLTTDAAHLHQCAFILRGVRSTIDFEYERGIADVNREIAGVETLLLFATPQLAHISSSVVRELLHYNHDVTPYLPTGMELPNL